MKKQKRTLQPVQDASAAGKNKRLPKKEITFFPWMSIKDKSKFHD